MNFKKYSAIIVLAVTFISNPVSADEQGSAREYRPLEAKAVSLQLAGKVEGTNSTKENSSNFEREGWNHFDRKEWSPAIDKFLSALSANPKNESACEGLAMSIYRSGDYDSAYRLAFELEHRMSRVHYVIEEAVLSDVRELLGQGRLTEAQELVKHFPESGTSYSEAHEMVRTTCTLAAAMNPGEDTTSDPSQFAAR